jgi:hypothetical protein
MSEDAGVEPWTDATSALAVRRSNHYARSNPPNFMLNTCVLQRTDRHPLPPHQLHHWNGDDLPGVRAQHPHHRLFKSIKNMVTHGFGSTKSCCQAATAELFPLGRYDSLHDKSSRKNY